MGRTEFRRVPAPGQVLHVFFVDVFFALVAMVAARHQLLAHGGVYLQVDDFIRGRQSQQPELIIKQPLQKALPLLRRELGALVYCIRCGVAVRNDDAARLVKAAPAGFVTGVAVYCIEA